MELRRFTRSVADRWATVAAIALFGVLAALIFTSVAGQNREPLFEATAALRFEPIEGETIADLTDDIARAQDVATIAAGDILESDPSALIVEDLANARLLFIRQGGSEAEAGTKAQALIQTFLDIDPTIVAPVDDLLVELVAEAGSIQSQIDALQASLTPEEEDLLAQQAFIDRQIGAINGRLVQLLIIEASAPLDQQDAIISERAFLTQQLASLEAQKDSLGEPPTSELTPEQALLLSTLQRRMEVITSRYESLYLRKLGVLGAGAIEPIVFNDLTPEPADPVRNAAIGLIGGLLIAVFTIVFLARTRQTLWLAEDITIPLLGEVPARPVSSNVADPWYDTAELGPRKTAIQALRSAVDAQVPPTGATVAFTGHGVPAQGVQALAADLAGSITSAGGSVLLVDANFEAHSALGEYRVGGTSLADVLRLNPDAPGFDAEVHHAVESAYLVRPGLSIIPSGPAPASPADSLAGRQFRSLVSAAQSIYDIVLVVVDAIGSPSAQVAMQRLKHGILVITPGTTTMPEVHGLLADVNRLRILMVGVVFLGKHDRLVSYISRRTRETRSERTRQNISTSSAPSPISRLHSYPIPDTRHSALVTHHSLNELAGELGAEELQPDANLGTELVIALNATSPENAYDAIADYLVTRTEDMITAQYGYGDLSDDLIHDVSENGFVTLRPLKDHRTVASWLNLEVEREVDKRTASELIESIESVLSTRVGEGLGIDEWLSEEFFRRHIARTDGEPVVWHLTSREGTVAVLVPAMRLEASRIETLIREVASSEVDELERYRKAATVRGDLEQAAVFEGRIFEVRDFETAMRSLIQPSSRGGGTRRGGVGWNPDWSLGMRPNLAPMQRAGLLPFDVLTEEEMAAIPASA